MAIYENRDKFADFDAEEISYFLDQGNASDFKFEIDVLRELRSLDFEVQHAGQYEDPVTEKLREFDIRASRIIEKHPAQNLVLGLAVECKNVSKYTPLVVYATERRPHENYLEVYTYSEGNSLDYLGGFSTSRFENCNIYRTSVVGRKIEQICRIVNDRKNEEARYSIREGSVSTRWNQALSSLSGMVPYMDGFDLRLSDIRAFFPLLVVPNDTLWWVAFDGNGRLIRGPEETDSIQLYVNHDINAGPSNDWTSISHLHITTLRGLKHFVQSVLDFEGEFEGKPVGFGEKP